MQKTKLGISVGLLGSAIFFTGLFAGYLAVIILTAYVLLFEENPWLRRSAVKAVTLMIFFSLVSALMNLMPDILNFIKNMVAIINLTINFDIINKIVTAFDSGLHIVEKILFIGLGLKAIYQSTIVITMVDNLISRYMD